MFPLVLGQNITGVVQEGIRAFQGNLGLLAGGVGLLIAAFIVLWLFKQIVANAVLGIIALLAVVYLLGVPVPLNALTIIVSVVGGLGGVAALLVAAFFGLL